MHNIMLWRGSDITSNCYNDQVQIPDSKYEILQMYNQFYQIIRKKNSSDMIWKKKTRHNVNSIKKEF